SAAPYGADLARAAAPGARFVEASAYEYDLPQCTAIVALGEPLTYHAPDSDAAASASYGTVPLLPRRIAFTARRRPA
ncbi:MAG TPA: hypothetical protein VFO94_13985, partial [Gammaproteobacteria bacterium]|nr:hypothetical protein [Gammaproteobacteria bacterium]